MRNARTRMLTWTAGLVFGLALTSARANADPVGFAVNQDSHDVSVVDLTNRTTRATIATLQVGVNDPGAEPSDAVVDPQSGWVYVATRSRLIAFNGRLAVSTPPVVAVPMRDKGTGITIDAPGRRLFVCHGALPMLDHGLVSEFSIADPAHPVLVAEHTAEDESLTPSTDLRYIAWDASSRRLYAVASDGEIFRTASDALDLFDMETSVDTPGGILSDPSGGVWISSRMAGNGRLFRIPVNTTISSFLVGFNNPRGLAWDSAVPGTILVAIDTQNVIRRFRPGTGTWDVGNVMTTGANPQDVAVTKAGAVVSLNRRVGDPRGNVTVSGVSQPSDTTGERSVALAVTEIERLTAVPVAKDFCWNALGDVKTQTFSVQNTRLDRAAMNLNPVTIGGSNPGNYALVGKNTCNAASLKFGATCNFTVQFTASGGCVQPPPPWGNPVVICSWPSEVVVSSTPASGSATTRIPVRGTVALNPCPP